VGGAGLARFLKKKFLPLINQTHQKFFLQNPQGLTLLSPTRPTYLCASFLVFYLSQVFFVVAFCISARVVN